LHDARQLAGALGLSEQEARAEVELLLTRVLGISKARLVAHPELAQQAEASDRYRDWLRRRMAGEPVAYILGEREFFGLAFHVDPAVLIPRPETELLVELALASLPQGPTVSVLDLGTGSGCIAVAIARLRPEARVVATDVSTAALAVAAANVSRHAASNVELRQGDCFEAVTVERFDLIVSNPPYVAEGDPHLGRGDLRFEPKRALTSGADGMQMLRTITAQAPRYLLAGGWLLLEHGYDQADRVRSLLVDAGFSELTSERDLAGHLRVSGGRWLASPVLTLTS